MSKERTSRLGEAALSAALAAGAFGLPGCDVATPAAAQRTIIYNDKKFEQLADQALELLELENVIRTPFHVRDGEKKQKIWYHFQVEFSLNPERVAAFIDNHNDTIRSWKHSENVPELSDVDTVLALIKSYSCLRCRINKTGQSGVSFLLNEPGVIALEECSHPLPVGDTGKYTKEPAWQSVLRLIEKVAGQTGLDLLREVIQWPEPPLPLDHAHPDSAVDFHRVLRAKVKIHRPRDFAENDAPWGVRIGRDDTPMPRGV